MSLFGCYNFCRWWWICCCQFFQFFWWRDNFLRKIQSKIISSYSIVNRCDWTYFNNFMVSIAIQFLCDRIFLSMSIFLFQKYTKRRRERLLAVVDSICDLCYCCLDTKHSYYIICIQDTHNRTRIKLKVRRKLNIKIVAGIKSKNVGVWALFSGYWLVNQNWKL